jgi:hypothetical protein
MENKKKKPTFKEIHDKTRVGMFLKDNAPDLLKTILGVAGSFIPGASGITDKISSLIKGSTELSEEQKVQADAYLTVLEIEMNDIASARDMYKTTDHEMADYVATRVINWNIWAVIGAVIIEIFTVIYLEDKVLIAIISGAIGGITTALLQERQQVINFFFGSSQGSKDKAKQLER